MRYKACNAPKKHAVLKTGLMYIISKMYFVAILFLVAGVSSADSFAEYGYKRHTRGTGSSNMAG